METSFPLSLGLDDDVIFVIDMLTFKVRNSVLFQILLLAYMQAMIYSL